MLFLISKFIFCNWGNSKVIPNAFPAFVICSQSPLANCIKSLLSKVSNMQLSLLKWIGDISFCCLNLPLFKIISVSFKSPKITFGKGKHLAITSVKFCSRLIPHSVLTSSGDFNSIILSFLLIFLFSLFVKYLNPFSNNSTFWVGWGFDFSNISALSLSSISSTPVR